MILIPRTDHGTRARGASTTAETRQASLAQVRAAVGAAVEPVVDGVSSALADELAALREEVAGLRAELEAQPAAEPTPRSASRSRTSRSRPRGQPTDKVTMWDAVLDVLGAATDPMHVSDITDAALATPGVTTTGQTPEASVAARLAVENKKRGGLVRRTAPGTYVLRRRSRARTRT